MYISILYTYTSSLFRASQESTLSDERDRSAEPVPDSVKHGMEALSTTVY